MPKEVTHWIVAERVTEALRPTPYGEILQRYPNIVKIGAVFHDLLYYLNSSDYPENENLSRAIHQFPNKLHAIHGEDSLAIVRGILKSIQYNQTQNEHLIAFMVGVITHIFTDIVWHPLVYNYTGNYHDTDEHKKHEAQYNHLKLEAVFDLYFCQNFSKLNKNYNLQNYVKGIEYPFDNLMREACYLYVPMKIEYFIYFYEKGLKRALAAHKILRRNVLNTYVLWTKYFKKSPERFKYGSLYHNGLYKYLPKLQEGLHFRNPVTGEPTYTTMEDMLQKAVDESVDFCMRILPETFGGASHNFKEVGKSLEHGQPAGKVYNMTHFDYFFV